MTNTTKLLPAVIIFLSDKTVYVKAKNYRIIYGKDLKEQNWNTLCTSLYTYLCIWILHQIHDVYTDVYIYLYFYVFIYIYVYIYIYYMYIHIYIYIYICIYIYI
jgi:hypothetical protein